MAAGERAVVTESKIVRRLVVSSIAWLGLIWRDSSSLPRAQAINDWNADAITLAHVSKIPFLKGSNTFFVQYSVTGALKPLYMGDASICAQANLKQALSLEVLFQRFNRIVRRTSGGVRRYFAPRYDFDRLRVVNRTELDNRTRAHRIPRVCGAACDQNNQRKGTEKTLRIHRPNENKMSCHERERAWQRVKGL